MGPAAGSSTINFGSSPRLDSLTLNADKTWTLGATLQTQSLVIEDGRVIHEERLLDDKGWRVRGVGQSPAGDIYIGIDDGRVMRLTPPDSAGSCSTDQGVESETKSS